MEEIVEPSRDDAKERGERHGKKREKKERGERVAEGVTVHV